MTEPLTPSDCDLRDFGFMQLDATRLLDSDLFAVSTGDEFKAAIALWCKSWQQVPAASLPNDDRVLAHLSGTGARWKKLKAMALRGFIECSDGRLYHPVVAEKANDAWAKKLSYRERSKKGNSKRWGSHKDTQQQSNSDPSGTALGVLEPPKGEGEGEGDNSVTNVTGPKPDSDQIFWDGAKAFIQPESKNPGAVIGKWVREHGKLSVSAAVSRAQLERPVQRIAFIEGCFRKSSKDEGFSIGGTRMSSPC